MDLFEKRQKRAQSLLNEFGLDAFAFLPGPNFAYLTDVHLHLMERPTLFILTRDGGQAAVMPALERLKWSAAMPEAETFYWDDADGPDAAFARLADSLGTDTTIGVEGLRMRVMEYLALARHWPQSHLQNADAALTDLRMLKDPGEVQDLRRAIEISEHALGDLYDGGIGGRSERELVARLKAAMLAHGATGFSFDPIILTGGEAANPHGDPSDRIVEPGKVLLTDFGASYGDMHADITRTVFCDFASDEHAALYDTVRRANEAGHAASQIGNTVGAVDRAATKVLAASPFADLILHKTGHGLGREIHEAPQIVHTNDRKLETGMVFTIEPGLYRQDDIGVRIEDNVVMTETGAECLTSLSRDLLTKA